MSSFLFVPYVSFKVDDCSAVALWRQAAAWEEWEEDRGPVVYEPTNNKGSGRPTVS